MKVISCPSCDATLDEMPKARRKCPECKEWIYVKKPFNNQQKSTTKVLMTKKQSADTDEQWKQYNSHKLFKGLSVEEWSAQNMSEASDALAGGKLEVARDKYLEIMGKVIDKEVRSISHREFCKCELLLYKKETETNYVCINKSSNKNLKCYKNSRSVKDFIHIDKALKEMPIPCNNEFCGCFYTHVFEEEMPKKKPWWKVL